MAENNIEIAQAFFERRAGSYVDYSRRYDIVILKTGTAQLVRTRGVNVCVVAEFDGSSLVLFKQDSFLLSIFNLPFDFTYGEIGQIDLPLRINLKRRTIEGVSRDSVILRLADLTKKRKKITHDLLGVLGLAVWLGCSIPKNVVKMLCNRIQKAALTYDLDLVVRALLFIENSIDEQNRESLWAVIANAIAVSDYRFARWDYESLLDEMCLSAAARSVLESALTNQTIKNDEESSMPRRAAEAFLNKTHFTEGDYEVRIADGEARAYAKGLFVAKMAEHLSVCPAERIEGVREFLDSLSEVFEKMKINVDCREDGFVWAYPDVKHPYPLNIDISGGKVLNTISPLPYFEQLRVSKFYAYISILGGMLEKGMDIPPEILKKGVQKLLLVIKKGSITFNIENASHIINAASIIDPGCLVKAEKALLEYMAVVNHINNLKDLEKFMVSIKCSQEAIDALGEKMVVVCMTGNDKN